MPIGLHVKKALAAKEQQKEDEMAIADPKTYVKTEPEDRQAEPSMAQVMGAMMQLLQEMRQASTSEQKEAALKQAEVMEELLVKTRPENAQAPGISVYSHPEGEYKHPKDPLKCKMTWVGYELQTDTLRPDEIGWLNKLEPGEFRVTKADGTKIPFKVSAKYSDRYDDSTQRFTLEQMDVWFPCKGEHRENHMSLVSYCQQAVNGSIPGVDELMREVSRLRQELETAKAGVIGAV